MLSGTIGLSIALMLLLQTVTVGIIVMVAAQVPSRLIATQMGTALLAIPFALLSAFFVARLRQIKPGYIALFCVTALVLVSFYGCDIAGMRRWICVGPLRIHVPAILVPSLLVSLSSLRNDDGVFAKTLFFGCATIASLAVAWSSDLSYATGLVCGLVANAMFRREKRETYYWICLSIFVLSVSLSRDKYIPPVLHTEGIMAAAWSSSAPLGILAVLSLLLANAAPLVLLKTLPSTQVRSGIFSLLTLFLVITLFGFTQLWPVPFLGFGAGPILGAALALGLISGRAQT